jgi:hypothetical protein
MTPSIQLLSMEKVQPLLDLLYCQDELASKKNDLVRLQSLLEDPQQPSDERRRCLRELAEAFEAIPRLLDEAERLSEDMDVAALEADLKAPVVGGNDDEQAQPQLPPQQEQQQQQQQEQQQQQPPPPIASFLERRDPTSVLLGFLDVASVHCGIGAAAPALRASVMGCVPRIGFDIRRIPNSRAILVPPLGAFEQLRHLEIRVEGCFDHVAWVGDITAHGLPAHLQSFGFDFSCPCMGTWEVKCARKWKPLQFSKFLPCPLSVTAVFETLLSSPWPKLRLLKLGPWQQGDFLDAALACPGLIFPCLQSLALPVLRVEDAGKLLKLLDHGALPALTALVTYDGFGTVVGTCWKEGSVATVAQQWELLKRLPGKESLQLGTTDSPSSWEVGGHGGDAWIGFATLLLDGHLPNLKCVPP